MNELKIGLDSEQTTFVPGQAIRGQVRWHCTDYPKRASLRLLWYTQGKGTEDAGVDEEMEFRNPGVIGSEAFEFAAPAAPWSFSGKLVSLVWSLELIVDSECVRRELTIAPSGREILLYKDMIVDASPA